MAAVAAWVTAQAATSGTQATMASALLLLTHPAELPYLLRWTFQTGRRRPVFSILGKSTNCNTWAAPACPSSPALPIPALDLHNLCPQSSAARGRASPEQAKIITGLENDGVAHVALISRNNDKLADELLAEQDKTLQEIYFPETLIEEEAADAEISDVESEPQETETAESAQSTNETAPSAE